MRTPGEILRTAREQKGLSVGDLSTRTRIPRGTVANIDRDSFDEINSEVFVRGFLRSYAREVDVDENVILSSFERHFGTRNTTETEAVTSRTTSRPIPSLYVIGAVCAIVVAVILVGLFVGNPAIATDPAKFPETKSSDWSMEEDVQKTRWLLEQPVDSNHDPK